MSFLLNYTRKPCAEKLYDPRLAYSMHLALSEDGERFGALNHNSGVLFVKATENADGSLNAKSLKNPWIFEIADGLYGVVAVRICGDGEADEESRGNVVFFRTRDFLTYEEVGLIRLEGEYIDEVRCACETALENGGMDGRQHASETAPEVCGRNETQCTDGMDSQNEDIIGSIVWRNEQGKYYQGHFCVAGEGNRELLEEPVCVASFAVSDREGAAYDIEGAVPHNCIEIPEKLAGRLRQKLLTPVNVGLQVPEQILVEGKSVLEKTGVTALYSDGTTAVRQVHWHMEEIDFAKKGTYSVKGEVVQEHFPFPMAVHRADPCIAAWQGKYYFIATNDADDNHTLYIRESDTIAGLAQAQEHLLLDSHTYPGIGGLLWAPEFHEINGDLYIFHAATPGEFYWEESHIMKLRKGGNPIIGKDWSAPERIVRKDGSELCPAGEEISLDMTCFFWEGDYYVVWSQRRFLPKDLGAWLYIAKLDPKDPRRLLTDPVVLSKPDYGWGNNHTFVEEGPYALTREDKLILTFSAAAVDASYVVGYLWIEKGRDLLDPKQWKKNGYPILTARSVPGEYGTGHNSYVTDERGQIWNVYHARPGANAPRCSGIRRVHFDVDGMPVLDLTEDKDLWVGFYQVETKLCVR